MKKFNKMFFSIFLILITSSFASAKSDNLLIKKCELLKQRFPNIKVDKILKGPIDGLCEIWSGTNVIYFYPDKNLLFFGEIWNTEGKSLTQESRDKILALKINKIPLEKAIKWGKGKVNVIIFTDPDCPYCRKVEKFLLSPLFENNIRAHIFLYPLIQLHPRAKDHALSVLCSKKPVKRLLAYAANIKNDLSIKDNNCLKKAEQRLQEMIKIGKQLNISGTPMVIVNKKVVRGAQIELIADLINKSLKSK